MKSMDAVVDGPQRVRVLIAESAELVRRGIRDVLTSSREFVVVGETSWHQKAVDASTELLPDITFLGLSRPRHDNSGKLAGQETLDQILLANPHARVIALVDGDEMADVLLAVRAGAKGVLLRNTPADALQEAVLHVLNGGCALDPGLTRFLFEDIASNPSQLRMVGTTTEQNPSVRVPLSARELEVLNLMAEGLGNKEIAARMAISPGTVKTHISHIFGKLHVTDRTSAVLASLRLGLLNAA
jgi:DNA-binding NarL/FixJ family response regulator